MRHTHTRTQTIHLWRSVLTSIISNYLIYTRLYPFQYNVIIPFQIGRSGGLTASVV
jgi:hypothetical protein